MKHFEDAIRKKSRLEEENRKDFGKFRLLTMVRGIDDELKSWIFGRYIKGAKGSGRGL